MTELIDDMRLTAIVDGLLSAADAPVTTDEELADAIFTAEFNGHTHIGRYLRARLAKRHAPPGIEGRPLAHTPFANRGELDKAEQKVVPWLEERVGPCNGLIVVRRIIATAYEAMDERDALATDYEEIVDETPDNVRYVDGFPREE